MLHAAPRFVAPRPGSRPRSRPSSPVRPGTRRTGRVTVLAVAVALIGGAQDARAQDRFGADVAFAGDHLVVLKPGAGRGPAGTLVFRTSGGDWERVASLEPIGDGWPGEGFGGSLAGAPGTAIVSAADPDAVWGGHLYRAGGDGWTGVRRVGLREGATSTGPAGGSMSWAALQRIMSPPARTVALDRTGRWMALAAEGRGEVRVMRAAGAGGAWEQDALVTVPAARDDGASSSLEGLGAALAIDRGVVAVGAPDGDSAGAVVVLDRDDDGTWRTSAVLTVDGLARGAGLGSAVALAGGELLAGAPGAGVVARFGPDDSGGWSLLGTLDAPTDGDVRGFGAALAAGTDDELWVGAPGGRGGVYGFRHDGSAWRPVHALTGAGLEPGSLLGASLAASGDLVAAGAPGVAGRSGRVAVLRRAAGGWSGAEWIEPGTPLPAVAGAEVRCQGGEAAGYDCRNVDLLAFLPLESLGAAPGERVSDIWGWTDPETGREYALVGRTAGMAVVDVTDPLGPAVLALVPGNPSGARDIKVYDDHAFFVGDGAGDHGLRVFDLTRVRSLPRPASPERAPVLDPDAIYDRVASAHNLVIDTESGFAFTVGTNTGGQSCGGGLHMIDIREPLSPTFAGCYTDSEGLIWEGRTHDAQCTVYRGPDEAYRGRQVCFASNETALRIVDVTDKANPAPISAVSYPGMAYVHQGWLTEDHRYFYMNDEVDELVGTTDRTRTLVWDVQELEDPVLVGELLGPDAATDHNLYIEGNRAYLANYQAGLRVVDVSDPENPVEIGHFDTTPYGANPSGFGGGAWTAYPFFESGTVIVSSMNEGLFLLRPRTIVP